MSEERALAVLCRDPDTFVLGIMDGEGVCLQAMQLTLEGVVGVREMIDNAIQKATVTETRQ